MFFSFGDEFEHVSPDFHRVPTAINPWIAGKGTLVFISFSAMEAICFLTCYAHSFPDLNQLQFIAVGNNWENLPSCSGKVTLLFGQDILGRLTDIRISMALRNKQVSIQYCADDTFDIDGQLFTESQMTLSCFEKKLGIRSGIRTVKPRNFNTFFEQLKYQNL